MALQPGPAVRGRHASVWRCIVYAGVLWRCAAGVRPVDVADPPTDSATGQRSLPSASNHVDEVNNVYDTPAATPYDGNATLRRTVSITGCDVDSVCLSIGLATVLLRWALVQWPANEYAKYVWLIFKALSPALSARVIFSAVGYVSFSLMLLVDICEESMTAIFAWLLARCFHDAPEVKLPSVGELRGQPGQVYIRSNKSARPWLSPRWLLILGTLDTLASTAKLVAGASLPAVSCPLKAFALPLSLAFRRAGLGKEEKKHDVPATILVFAGSLLCGWGAVCRSLRCTVAPYHVDVLAGSGLAFALMPEIGLLLMGMSVILSVLQGQCKEFLIHRYRADGSEVQRLASIGSAAISTTSLVVMLLVSGQPPWGSKATAKLIVGPLALKAMYKALDHQSGIKMTQVVDYTWKKLGGVAQMVGALLSDLVALHVMGNFAAFSSFDRQRWGAEACLVATGVTLTFVGVASRHDGVGYLRRYVA